MKLVVAILAMGLALPAGACFDPAYRNVENVQEVLAIYDQQIQFSRCVNKLEAAGVNMRDVSLKIKSRPANDTGNVIKWFRIQGKDSAGRQTFIVIEQRLARLGRGRPVPPGFTCGEPSNRITRGC